MNIANIGCRRCVYEMVRPRERIKSAKATLLLPMDQKWKVLIATFLRGSFGASAG